MIPKLFDEVIELHHTLRFPSLKDMGGSWVYDLPGGWQLAMNGTNAELELKPNDSMGCRVPPFSCAFFFNGWLAGIVDPGGGSIAAGRLANETSLLKAFDEAIQSVKP